MTTRKESVLIIKYKKMVENREDIQVASLKACVKSNPLIGFFQVSVEDADSFLFDFVNDAYAHLIEESASSIVGQHVRDIFGEQDTAVIISNFRRAIHLKKPLTYDEVLFLPHGRIWWQIYLTPEFHENGEVKSLTGTVTNMTDQKRMENALREAERKNRALITSMPDVILKLNRSGTFTDLEEGKDTVLGLSPNQFVGKSLQDILPPDLAKVASGHLDKLFKSRETQVFEYNLNFNDAIHDFEVRLVFINNNECLGIVRDITEKNQALRDLEIAKEQAEAANKAKSAFLATVSHELRTPLNAILGFSDVLRNQMFGSLGAPKYLDYAFDIFSSGSHLLEIINDIIDLSKLESNTAELQESAFELSKIIQASIKPFEKNILENRLQVNLRLEQNLPMIYADKRGVKQMLSNLVSNAVKFTPQKGTINVVARKEPSGALTLIVEDTGIGLDHADIPKALAPFQQVECSMRRYYEGTGLGLPLVKSIMELHGGSLEIKSKRNVGTKVYMRFPLNRTMAAEASVKTGEDTAEFSEKSPDLKITQEVL